METCSDKKETVWSVVELEEEYVGQEAGEARKIFRKLAEGASELRDKTYEEFYGEEMDLGDLRVEADPDFNLYFKRGEENPFFFVSKTRIDRTPDKLTGQERVHAITECRIPIRDN